MSFLYFRSSDLCIFFLEYNYYNYQLFYSQVFAHYVYITQYFVMF